MGEFARADWLVEGGWVEEHLNDPGIRVVDCDTPDAFNRAHLPGAVGYRDRLYKNPADSRFVMEPEQFAAAMAELGVGDETEVIAYDAAGSLNAGRFWWCLNYYGHPRVRVLNGGWNLWLKEGRPVTMATTKVEAASFTPRPDESLRATAEYIMEALSRPDVVVLDVRSDGEYEGTSDRGNKRAGHIPGAVHIEWLNNITQDDVRCLKSPEELREMFAAAGITPDKEVITV